MERFRLASRIDIRVLKKQLKQKKSKAAAASAAQAKDLKSALEAQNKTIVHHLLEKFELAGKEATVDGNDADADEVDDDVRLKLEDVSEVKEEVEDDGVEQEGEDDEATLDGQGELVSPEAEASQSDVNEDDDDEDDDDEMKHEITPESNREPPKEELVHNPWSKRVKVNNDFNDDKPFVSDDFKVAFDERKRKQKEGGLLNGWEECDIADCFCKEEAHGQGENFALNQNFAEVALVLALCFSLTICFDCV